MVDLFAAHLCTCRIFNAYHVNASMSTPKAAFARRLLFFSLITMLKIVVENKGSALIISLLVNMAFWGRKFVDVSLNIEKLGAICLYDTIKHAKHLFICIVV